MSPQPRRRARRTDDTLAAQTDAVVQASRALVGIAVASIAGVADTVTVPQFRVLMMVYTRGPLNLAAVAKGLNVNPSNASRTCDKVIKSGYLNRAVSTEDRRHITLTLTTAGRRLVEKVITRRRIAIDKVLATMSTAERDQLAAALSAFAAAADEAADDQPIAFIWPPTT